MTDERHNSTPEIEYAPRPQKEIEQAQELLHTLYWAEDPRINKAVAEHENWKLEGALEALSWALGYPNGDPFLHLLAWARKLVSDNPHRKEPADD